MSDSPTTLGTSQLATTLEAGPPDNEARSEGYALVDVLDPEAYAREHIPGSINIPKDDLRAFERRFDPEKKIVVYCASAECPASREAARGLVERGFRHVYDFEGGLRAWKEAGCEVESGEAERAAGEGR